GLPQGRLDPGSGEVPACKVELGRLDVDAEQAQAGELLPEHRQYRTHAASDLEQACSGRELGAIGDQAVAPVLSLLDEALLLPSAVAVNVVGHTLRLDRS